MLRITPLDRPPQLILLLEGRLVGPFVDLLAAQGQNRLSAPHTLEVHLGAVQQIDAAGWTLLKAWQREGVLLRGGTPFIDHLLALHSRAKEEP